MKKGHVETAAQRGRKSAGGTTATSHLKPQFIKQIQVEKYLKFPSKEQGMIFSSGMVEGKGAIKGG